MKFNVILGKGTERKGKERKGKEKKGKERKRGKTIPSSDGARIETEIAAEKGIREVPRRSTGER